MISSTQLADTSKGAPSKDLDLSKWNFKMFNPKQDSDNALLNAYCQICFRLNDKAAQKCNFKEEIGLNMIHCYGCLTSAHIYCYGMNTPYKVETNHKGEKIYMFLCQKCRILGPNAKQACQVCQQTDGGLKKCDDDTWVHIICAIFTDTYIIPNFETMEICRSTRTEKEVDKRKGRPPFCDHCGVHGPANLVKCCDHNCTKSSHIYCLLKHRAQQDRKKEKADDVPGGIYWSFSLVLNDQIIGEMIQTPKNSPVFGVNIKSITDYAEHANKLMDDYHIVSPKKEEDPLLKKKRGRKRETVSKIDDPALNQVVSAVLDKGNFVFKAVEGLHEGFCDSPYYDLKNYISKRIVTHCTAHKVPEKYCICNRSSQDEEDRTMVGCDSCDNWFDNGCIGLQEDQISEIDKYFCARCRNWGEIKADLLKDVALQQNEKLALTTPYKFKQFTPNNTQRFTICDLLTSGLLYETLTKRALNAPISVKELYKLIIYSFVLPLNFSQHVQNLCYKLFKAMVLDEVILQNDITDFKIESCLTLDNKIKEHVLENNGNMLESFGKLFKLYHNDCYVTTDTYTKLENIIFFLRWQQKTIEILQTRTIKPQLEEVEALLSEYNHIALTYSPQTTVTEGGSTMQGTEQMTTEVPNDPIIGEFYEKQQLESLINSCKEWLEEYNNLLKKSVENLEEFHNSIENEQDDCMIIEEVAMSAEEETSISRATRANIEKVIKRYVEFQDNKIKAQELEELLHKAEQFPVYFTQELKNILDEKQKTEEFRRIISQIDSPQLTPETLQKIIIDNDSYVLHVPEMKELYELMRQFKIFNTKYLYLTSRIDANIKYYSQVSKENLKKSEKPMKITIDDVKRTLQEARQIPLNLSMYILPLQERLNETLKFQNKLNSFLHKPLDTPELQALKHEAFKLGLFIPEIETIKDKINLSAEIKNKIQGESTYEKIEFQLGLAERHLLDASLISELRLKKTQVEQLKQHSLIFISKRIYGEKDLKKVYTLLYEARKSHIDFPEKNHLLNVLKSFSWFVKLWLLLNALSKPNQDGPADKASNLFDKFDISLVFKLNISEDIGFCNQQSTQETLMQYAEKYTNQFQSLMREGAQITHPDVRLKDLFSLYSKKLWALEVKKLKDGGVMDPAVLLKLYEQAREHHIEKLDENYQWLEQTYQRYDNWINMFTTSIYLKDLRTLCEPENIQEYHKIIQDLIEKYPGLNIQMEHIYRAIHYINNSMEWLFKAENCQSLLANGRKVAYDALRDLYNIAIDLNLPLDFPYFDKISSIYTNATTLIDESLEFFKVIDEFDLNQEIKTLPAPEQQLSEPRFRFCVDTSNGMFKMNFYEKIEERYSFSKALRLYQQLQESQVSFDKDIEVVGVHRNKYEAWMTKFAEVRRKYKLDEILLSGDNFPENTYLKNIDKIVEEIDNLKVELTNQILSEEQKENEIYIYEWAIAAFLLLNKQDLLLLIPPPMRPSDCSFRENNFAIWESLINCLKKHENKLSAVLLKKVQKSCLYRKLTEQIMKGKHFIDLTIDMVALESTLLAHVFDMTTEDLRMEQDREYLRTIAEHNQTLKEMEELLVNIDKERAHFHNLIKKNNELLRQYESLGVQYPASKQPKQAKANVLTVENLLRELLGLPVKYLEEDKNLANALRAFDVIENDLKKVREFQQSTGKELVDARLAEVVVRRYKDSLIFHTDAEKILKEYDRTEPVLHRVEMLINDNKLGVEDAVRYYEILKNSKIEFGARIEKARMRLWQKIYEMIKAYHNEMQNKDKIKESPSKIVRVTYDVLKLLINDTYAAYDGKAQLGIDKQEVSHAIGVLEEIIEKVENKLKEIYAMTDAKAAARIDPIVLGLVSLKTELATHCQKLSQDSSYVAPKVVSVLKYPLKNQQNNVQGIVIYKNTTSNVVSNPVSTAPSVAGGLVVKGKPGRKPLKSKDDGLKPKRKESDDLTVNEAGGKKGKRKFKGGQGDEEIEEETTKKLKTDTRSQKIQNREEEVNNTLREKMVNQLLPLIEQNSHFTQVMNKSNFIKQTTDKIEETLFKETGDSRNQYNWQSKMIKNLFSKLKNFRNISRNLNKFQFDNTIIKYLLDNTLQFDSIENSLKPPSTKTIMDLIGKTDSPASNPLANFTSIANGITSLTPNAPGSTMQIVPLQSTIASTIASQNGETPHNEQSKQAQEEEEKLNALIRDIQSEECPKFPFKEIVPDPSVNVYSKGSTFKGEERKAGEVEFQHGEHTLKQREIFDSSSPRRRKEIYRVHNGEFAFTMGNADDEGKRYKVMLMTMEPFEYLQNFPRIPSKPVKMAAKLDLKELEPYVDKIIESESRNFRVLLGWFQVVDGDNGPLNDIALFLKKTRRAGRCKYVHNCTVYSLHVDDLKPAWLLKSNFDISGISHSKQIKPSPLVFLMVSKGYQITPEEPPLEPHIVFRGDDLENSASSDDEHILSPGSPVMKDNHNANAGWRNKTEGKQIAGKHDTNKNLEGLLGLAKGKEDAKQKYMEVEDGGKGTKTQEGTGGLLSGYKAEHGNSVKEKMVVEKADNGKSKEEHKVGNREKVVENNQHRGYEGEEKGEKKMEVEEGENADNGKSGQTLKNQDIDKFFL